MSTKRFIGAVEDEWQLYSDDAADYELGLPVGFGASSTVYQALYKPSQTYCAVKVVDLDKLPQHALHLLKRETQLMSLSKHPNVLRVRGSWTDQHKLSIAFRLMNAGSAADVMRYAWPGGMDEDVVKCILKQALEGLHYLHINGFIHRDIKAANLLIDDDGTVLLGDLGVAADMTDEHGPSKDTDAHHRRAISFEPTTVLSARSGPPASPTSPLSNPSGPSSNHHHATHAHASTHTTHPHNPHTHTHRNAHGPLKMHKRKSFVGTPCWMAPEVINGQQYDASADIWSLGITAIELTQGRPPRSRESSRQVLVRTVTDAPPTLPKTCGDGSTPLSPAFIALVAQMLAKSPSARPSAGTLLDSPVFRNAKKNPKAHLKNTVLKGLPPLTARQERRRLQSAHPTRFSVGSWDFASAAASPRTSVIGHGSGWKTPRHTGSAAGSTIHSRAVSDQDEYQHDHQFGHGPRGSHGSHGSLPQLSHQQIPVDELVFPDDSVLELEVEESSFEHRRRKSRDMLSPESERSDPFGPGPGFESLDMLETLETEDAQGNRSEDEGDEADGADDLRQPPNAESTSVSERAGRPQPLHLSTSDEHTTDIANADTANAHIPSPSDFTGLSLTTPQTALPGLSTSPAASSDSAPSPLTTPVGSPPSSAGMNTRTNNSIGISSSPNAKSSLWRKLRGSLKEGNGKDGKDDVIPSSPLTSVTPLAPSSTSGFKPSIERAQTERKVSKPGGRMSGLLTRTLSRK